MRHFLERSLVNHDEPVKGHGVAAGGSRVFKPASEQTYLKHAELTDTEYKCFLSLLSRYKRVFEILGPDLKHLVKEEMPAKEEDKKKKAPYRTPIKAEQRLHNAYMTIAMEFDIREPVDVVRVQAMVDPETEKVIRIEAKRLGLPRQEMLGNWIKERAAQIGQENRKN